MSDPINTVPKSVKKRPRGGSRKGVPNKSTALAKETIAAFVDGNSEKLQGWLEQIAETHGPLEAFKAFTSLLEYHVPKIQRTEVTGKDGGPQEHKHFRVEGWDD